MKDYLPDRKQPVMSNKPEEAEIELGNEALWDAKDVARYLKVSRSWVYHQTEAGLLPCVRLQALLRFEPHLIRAYAQEQRSDGKRPGALRVVRRALRKGNG